MRASRRSIIRLLAVAAGALLQRRPAAAAPGGGDPETQALAACLHAPASAAAIGAAYLRERPEEGDAAMLADAVRARIAEADPRLAGVPAAAAPRRRLRRALRRAAAADLAADDFVVVDGWVLSRTEARLYALVSRA